MSTKKEQSESRRWQLLEIGLEQFIRYGYYGTSTRKIAEAAGVSSGLMFHYFPNKEALYLELIRIGCETISASYEDEPEPFEFFEREAGRIYEILEANRFSARMFVFIGAAMFSAPYVSEEAAELIRANPLIPRGADYIRRGQAQGVIRAGDPTALSAAFYGALQSAAEWKAASSDNPVPEKEWLLDILRP